MPFRSPSSFLPLSATLLAAPGTIPLPALGDANAKLIGLMVFDSDELQGSTGRVFSVAGPDSTTAYNATVTFRPTYDGKTFDTTQDMALVITNAAPLASIFANTSALIFGAFMAVNSGTISMDGNTNGRKGVTPGVAG